MILLLLAGGCATVPVPTEAQRAAGKEIAFDRNRGNCLACHKIADGDMPGNIGPELTSALIHAKDRNALLAVIWDATRFNPNTSMPPYGKNKVLTDAEIDRVVDYLWSLS